MAVPQMQGLDTLYKPWGMTAGGMVGRRETDMEAADLLNLEEGMLGNVIKQVEASRAANDFNDPRMEMLRQQGIMGDNMTKDATGRLKQGTLTTDISSGNAKNTAAQSGDELKNMLNVLDGSIAMIQANGPAGMAMAMQRMPPELQKIVEQAGPNGPGVLMKMSEMLKAQLAQTPAHMGAMELEDRKSENDFIIKDNSEMEANKRNDADNAARSSDIAQRRAEVTARKEETDKRLLEDQITRRLAYNKDKLKLLQQEFSDRKEELSMPAYGLNKEQKAARTKKLEKEMADIKEEGNKLTEEMARIEKLSTFAPKQVETTASKPQAPALPPGVTVVPSSKK